MVVEHSMVVESRRWSDESSCFTYSHSRRLYDQLLHVAGTKGSGWELRHLAGSPGGGGGVIRLCHTLVRVNTV